MSITPQAIKDQEFQVRFRGYETVEVKAYLELVAEEFFALQEDRRVEEEEKQQLYAENFQLRERNQELEREIQEKVEALSVEREAIKKKDEKIAQLTQALDDFEQDVAEVLAGKNKLKEELALLQEELDQEKKAHADSCVEMESLHFKITQKESQIEELRQEEIDFKATIFSAQKFAESVKQQAEEDAAQLLEKAKKEEAAFRRKAEQELADLPLKIEELRRHRVKVRQELRDILHSYLEMLDVVDDNVADEVEEFSSLLESFEDGVDGAGDENDIVKYDEEY